MCQSSLFLCRPWLGGAGVVGGFVSRLLVLIFDTIENYALLYECMHTFVHIAICAHAAHARMLELHTGQVDCSRPTQRREAVQRRSHRCLDLHRRNNTTFPLASGMFSSSILNHGPTPHPFVGAIALPLSLLRGPLTGPAGTCRTLTSCRCRGLL